MARIVELILTDELVGKGTEESPRRRAFELWTKDGTLVARDDCVGRELDLDDWKEALELNLGAVK